jgi:hypothetical protein
MKKLLLITALFLGICGSSHAQNSTKAKTSHPVDSVKIKPDKDPFGPNGMMGMMNSMGPMMGNMAKAMMDAQLEYYKQPGKLEEIAKLTKQYYNALLKEGFSEDQALKIVISDSFLPKGSGAK